MGISPTDKSQEFIKSGMTLITQQDSDKYMKKVEKNIKGKKESKS
tara:strand:- start:359 stop:493 length:135 start_codon:yes stop_codon:yes gene_type:complete